MVCNRHTKQFGELLAGLRRHVEQTAVMHKNLADFGPWVMKQLRSHLSFRAIGRHTGVSPTYLSLVANRKAVVSVGTFLKLATLLEFFRKLDVSAGTGTGASLEGGREFGPRDERSS